MSTVLQFDDETSRRLEAIYVTPDVVAQRKKVLRALELRPSERVLDIGTGPGFLASEMAGAVGSSGRICGIDVSESMIAKSRGRCADQPWVEFQLGEATRLSFPDGHFDAVVSTQVYEFVSDITTALAEAYRVTRPGGRLLVLDTDWDSIVWHTTVRSLMDRVLAAWEEHLIHPHLPRTLSAKLKQAGFQLQHREVIPLFNPEYDENTYSYRAIGVIAGFVAGRQGITQKEAAGWAESLHAVGAAGTYFFSLNRYLFLAVKPEGHAAG